MLQAQENAHHPSNVPGKTASAFVSSAPSMTSSDATSKILTPDFSQFSVKHSIVDETVSRYAPLSREYMGP